MEFFVRLQVKAALYEYRRFQKLLSLFADTNLIDMEYNRIEVCQKEEDGVWRVIHSTWSFIRPMEKRRKKKIWSEWAGGEHRLKDMNVFCPCFIKSAGLISRILICRK